MLCALLRVLSIWPIYFFHTVAWSLNDQINKKKTQKSRAHTERSHTNKEAYTYSMRNAAGRPKTLMTSVKVIQRGPARSNQRSHLHLCVMCVCVANGEERKKAEERKDRVVSWLVSWPKNKRMYYGLYSLNTSAKTWSNVHPCMCLSMFQPPPLTWVWTHA